MGKNLKLSEIVFWCLIHNLLCTFCNLQSAKESTVIGKHRKIEPIDLIEQILDKVEKQEVLINNNSNLEKKNLKYV